MCMALHLLGSACRLTAHVHHTAHTWRPLYLNVLTLKYIFDYGEQGSYGIDYAVHDAKEGDFQDFMWASLLVVSYYTSRMVLPHGMSVIPCAGIDSWSSSKSQARKEVIGQTRGIVESLLRLPPDKEFKDTHVFLKVQLSNCYHNIHYIVFVKSLNYLFSGRSISHQLSNKFLFLVKKNKAIRLMLFWTCNLHHIKRRSGKQLRGCNVVFQIENAANSVVQH